MDKKEFDVMKAIFGIDHPVNETPITVPLKPDSAVFQKLRTDILATMNLYEREIGHVIPFVMIAHVREQACCIAECQVMDWIGFSDAFVQIQEHHIRETLQQNGLA